MNSAMLRAAGSVVVLAAMLAACGGASTQNLPPQKWQDLEVRVESRPSPLGDGANEFLVMVANSRGKPAYDLVVSLRTSDRDPWIQAIEDGQVGVYRRAVKIEGNGKPPVLQVQIKLKDNQGVLYFPLQQE